MARTMAMEEDIDINQMGLKEDANKDQLNNKNNGKNGKRDKTTKEIENAQKKGKQTDSRGQRTDVSLSLNYYIQEPNEETLAAKTRKSGKTKFPRRDKKAGTEKRRTIWKLGTWNIRGLNGKEGELSHEFEKAKLDILGITETKKKQSGELLLEGGHLLIYSGVNREKRAAAGVGCLVHRNRIKDILDWESVTERVIKIELKEDNGEIMTIIVVYGPDENENKEAKDVFWEKLNTTTDNSKGKLYIIGDFNARVGNNGSGNTEAVGKFGENAKNNNGSRLIDYCEINELIVANTFYEHKNIHKYTGQGPRETEKSIIDYILVEKYNRRVIQDVRVRRGPEINSDHYLVEAKIKCMWRKDPKLKVDNKIVEYTKTRIYKLRNEETAKRYELNIAGKIEMYIENKTLNEQLDLEDKWTLFKTIVRDAAKDTCGVSKKCSTKKQTEWWSQEIKEQIRIKKVAWKKYLRIKTRENYEIYKEERRKVKESVKKSKEQSWKEFGEKLESNSKENQKLFYRALKFMRKEKVKNVSRITDKKGKPLMEDKAIMDRWREHFQELLCIKQAQSQIDSVPSPSGIKEAEELITIEEVAKELKKIKNGKAAGHDGIAPEMLKFMGTEGTKLLVNVYNDAWKNEKIPGDWEVGIIIPIFKKGDPKQCSNYRGISLLCTALKLYERILEQKLRPIIEPTLLDSQSGFRKGHSVQDHIFTTKQVIEKTLKTKTQAYMAFIDLEKAFDSVQRQILWSTLTKRRVSEKLIRAIKSLYIKNRNYVICKNMKSNEFETKVGLRQGGVMSPVLFTIFMDEIMRQCAPKLKKLYVGHYKLKEVGITECAFADDIVVLAESEEHLQKNLNVWNITLEKYGMKINIDKTKVMMIAHEQKILNIQINNTKIEQVNQFTYLGTIIERDGSQDLDINERIKKATNIFHAIKNNFIGKKEITRMTKMTVFKTIFRSTLTYGCETWVLSRRMKSKIQAIEMKYYRKVKGITRMDRIRNSTVREELNVKPVAKFIEERQLGWWGHLKRMSDDRPVRKIWEARIRGKRSRGRPKEDWNTVIAKNIKDRGITMGEATNKARDKREWSKFIHE